MKWLRLNLVGTPAQVGADFRQIVDEISHAVMEGWMAHKRKRKQ
jgi:hypothetical protein